MASGGATSWGWGYTAPYVRMQPHNTVHGPITPTPAKNSLECLLATIECLLNGYVVYRMA